MHKQHLYPVIALLALGLTAGVITRSSAARPSVGSSPWGPKDEIGRLNLMTPESRSAVLKRIAGGKVYDLSVEYFVGMPSWQAAGDPPYQMWMTHTPHGDHVADSMGVG
jgi:hypothetical protein